LVDAWRERLERLRAQLSEETDPVVCAGLAERITFLERNLAAGGGAARFFAARMRFDYALKSNPIVEDPNQLLPGQLTPGRPWPVRFWMGGWDADTLCGFCSGQLELPASGEAALLQVRLPRRLI
jgi:hypothetical protein